MRITRKYYIYVFTAMVALSLVNCKDADNLRSGESTSFSGKLLIENDRFIAGDNIIITYRLDTIADIVDKGPNDLPQLYIQSSFGNSLITPAIDRSGNYFELPEELSAKSGEMELSLIHAQNLLDVRSIKISPDTLAVSQLENYLGPPNINTGGRDFAMLVVMATDPYDNLLPEKTPVDIKQQFRGITQTETNTINDRLAWRYVNSPDKTGRIIISAVANKSASKESVLDVYPNIPTGFNIGVERIHEYADGNEIATFFTSRITDAFGNTIADGTNVDFLIRKADDTMLKGSGLTINGIAKSEMLHPSGTDTWKVRAMIEGMAISDEIQVQFEPAVKDFVVEISEDHRRIRVGPIKSYLEQLIPDGAEVELAITGGSTLYKQTRNGYASFELPESFYPSGSYELTIRSFDITKKLILKLR